MRVAVALVMALLVLCRTMLWSERAKTAGICFLLLSSAATLFFCGAHVDLPEDTSESPPEDFSEDSDASRPAGWCVRGEVIYCKQREGKKETGKFNSAVSSPLFFFLRFSLSPEGGVKQGVIKSTHRRSRAGIQY